MATGGIGAAIATALASAAGTAGAAAPAVAGATDLAATAGAADLAATAAPAALGAGVADAGAVAATPLLSSTAATLPTASGLGAGLDLATAPGIADFSALGAGAADAGAGIAAGLGGAGTAAGAGAPLDLATAPGVAGATGAPAASGITGGAGISAAGAAAPASVASAPLDLTSAAGGSAAGGTAAGAATPAASSGFSVPGLLSGAEQQIAKNPLALVGAGGLVYDLLQGNQKPAGYAQLESQAQQASTQAGQLEGYLTSGQLPAGVQASLDSAKQSAIAAVRQQYATRGMTGSSAEAQDLARVNEQVAGQGATIAQQLYQTGMNQAQLSDQIYAELMQTMVQQDAQMSQAVGSFAGSLALMGSRSPATA